MSETTSTGLSVAQANSTESVHAGSTRHSYATEPASTKRICFYKSGDPRFHGIKMVVTNRSFKTFDALLDNLSKKVPLPFGVRNITTPHGMHHITALEELEDGKSYICSHQKKIKPINLERASKMPLLWKSSRPISARRKVAQLARQNEVVPFQRENTIAKGCSKKLVVFRNGDTALKHSIILNKKTTQNFDAFLDQITEVTQCPVFKLYSTDGRRILSIHALLLGSGSIVAAGREPFKPANYDSEREFLPTKLPGISNRVFPKSRSKAEMESHLKIDEPISTSPSGHPHSLSSDKICNKGSSLVDFSYMPENEISLTEHWPQAGEDLPVISPGDNIEKSVHLNSDGSMTVEMKVRFKIKEEETINWSTTVSRSDLPYYESKLLRSTVDSELQAVGASNSSLKTTGNENKRQEENAREKKSESGAEAKFHETRSAALNINTCRTYSASKAKTHFHRPPTPGIRRVQERKPSINSHRRVTQGNMLENVRQITYSNETEHEKIQSASDIVTYYNKQVLTTADSSDRQYNRANKARISMESNEGKHVSANLCQESFKLLETTSTDQLQSDGAGKTVVRKSDITTKRRDFVHLIGTTQQNRPHSAGKQIFHQDPFQFKEIKRSVSASITFSEPSKSHKEVSHAMSDFVCTKEGSSGVVSGGNIVTRMAVSPCMKTSCEAQTPTADFSSLASSSQMQCSNGLENNIHTCSDTQSTYSVGQKKKKKTKNVDDQVKQRSNQHEKIQMSMEGGNVQNGVIECSLLKTIQKSITKDEADTVIVASSKLSDTTTCDEEIHTTNSIMSDETLIPPVSTSPQQYELGTVKKIKGNTQMAKVKPRWVKKMNVPVTSQSQNNEDGTIQSKNYTGHNFTAGKGITDYIGSILTSADPLYINEHIEHLLMEHTHQQEVGEPAKTSKKSHKSSRKEKSQKKKPQPGKIAENKKPSGSESLDIAKGTDSPIPHHSLESYVQSWLQNIFPNAALPVIQLLSSTRKDEEGIHSNNGQSPHSDKEGRQVDEIEAHGNINSKHTQSLEETDQLNPIPTERSVGKEMFSQQDGLLDGEGTSVLMEQTKLFAELFVRQIAGYEKNVFCDGNKTEELLKWIVTNHIVNMPERKPSTDVAVQVEAEPVTNDVAEYLKNDCTTNMLLQQQTSSPMLIQKPKGRYLEKSFSVPGLSSEATTSSSQLLLAWVIVLQLKQGMKHMPDDMSQSSSTGSLIFTLLQSLKKIAITERAEDLKAAVVYLQESVIRHDLHMQNPTYLCEGLSTQEFAIVPPLLKSYIGISSNHNDNVSTEGTDDIQNAIELHEKTDILQNEKEDNVLSDDMDDLRFCGTMSARQLSSEDSKNNICPATDDKLQHYNDSILELQESTNYTTTNLFKTVEQCYVEETKSAVINSISNDDHQDRQVSEEIPMNLSRTCSVSPMSNVAFKNDPSMDASSGSTKKTTKVKMIVQEMEQRKYSQPSSEYRKCLQSPISSDWSDYRPDSDESLVSDTLRASSEIMTESGEEQVQEKPSQTGYVKRAIERLYGKAEAKLKPSRSPISAPQCKLVQKEPEESHLTVMKENIDFSHAHQWWSKENILRSLSSSSNSHRNRKQDHFTSSLKSTSLPLLEPSHGISCQEPESSPNYGLEIHLRNKDGHSKTELETNSGVLIDKGRWLLKENHLVRRSPPETTGMYGHLDTTSVDTFLDNTSDEVPYPQFLETRNQQLPLAEVSSSEIEDMIKPHHYGCHYFNMPHGSDSEPFYDKTFNIKTKIRPKSSAALTKSKKHDSLSQESCTTPAQQSAEITGSLPSFTTVDLHFSDNKVHPLVQPIDGKVSEDQPSNSRGTTRGQVREQDSLDKLHTICGQHCPILTAIINPINEESRGFAYRRSSDIENLMVLHSLAENKMHFPLLDWDSLTDENNNTKISYTSTKIASTIIHDLDAKISLCFGYKGLLGETSSKKRRKEIKGSECLLNITIGILNTPNCTIHANNLFQDITYATNDENNNILYHHIETL